MIFVREALERIQSNVRLLSPIAVPLRKARGLVLAEDVFAGIAIPAFNQSAMDGYAFRFADFVQSNELLISHEVAAGDPAKHQVAAQQAVRVFTGAAIPAGLDTVVIQEKTEVQNNRLKITDNSLVQGRNVRLVGSEIKKGDLALAKETLLTPAAVGFLASLGVTQVSVFPNPVVHIIVTGNELQQPGRQFQAGQVYESNGEMLRAALDQLHIVSSTVTHVRDDKNVIATLLRTALASADLILLTGGVSAGDYDFVVQAAEECGVEKLFHKVAQRPGKPLYAGSKEGKMVFGLPGNPASVLTCFYNYVVASIEACTGRKALLERRQLPLLSAFSKKIALTQFLKASASPNGVTPLGAQESFRLSTFSVANCLIVLPEEARDYREGDMVDVLLLPYL
ncbi:molybdopterin molybdotransferase MoeA [Flavisolibacter sp. BT320]|nr:molybdopterin molybdotransferase MoeA [Flavisolibacter longurius]